MSKTGRPVKVPPKVLSEQARQHALMPLRDNGRSVPSRRDPRDLLPASDRGSLPVLEAFQEFLDNERRGTQRRIRMMAAVFGALLAAMGGVILFVSLAHFGRMRNALQRVHADVSAYRDAALRAENTAAQGFADAAQAARTLESRLAAGTQILDRTQLRLQALDGRVDDGLTNLHSLLTSLRAENASLRDALQTVETRLPLIYRDLDLALARRVEEQKTAEPRSRPAILAISIRPPDAASELEWRIPIPE